MEIAIGILLPCFALLTRASCHGDNSGLCWLLESITSLAHAANDMSLQECNGWTWQLGDKEVHKWTLPNHSCSIILSFPRTKFVKLNCRWRANFAARAWVCF